MFLLFGAFLAGALTVLAPCVLPLLPIIIGGSVQVGGKKRADRTRPLIIAASLAFSLMLFTLLLKVTTLFINVPPETYNYISGGILLVIGLLILFPILYETLIIKLNVQAKSQRFLGKSVANKNHLFGPIITGAALGPVFSSCSPVYAYILASILPVNFNVALAYIAAYILGLSVVLLVIGYLGQRAVRKLRWASNPRGWFQRVIAVIFILVGILIITGSNIKLQTWVSEHTPFNLDNFVSKLIPKDGEDLVSGKDLNVRKPYQAPEFIGLTDWMNTPDGKPLTKQDLKGKVVLIDFWTYSCINCIRTEPYLKGWYQTYKDNNFVVVGVHAPEFSFERVPANVSRAVKEAGITYPVALDNNLATWSAYHNQYWPAQYLIDKDGTVRRQHSGEGDYLQMENAIRSLLSEKNSSLTTKRYLDNESSVPVTSGQTPETYLGVSKARGYTGAPTLYLGTHEFTPTATLEANQWTLGGKWQINGETITSRGGSSVKFRIAAKDAYLVAGSVDGQSKSIGVKLNGQPISQTDGAGNDIKGSKLSVNMSQLYKLVSKPKFDNNMTVELSVPAGVSLNAFTFGS